MNKNYICITLLISTILMSGCTSFMAERYASDVNNLIRFKELSRKNDGKFHVKYFTTILSNDSYETCRGNYVVLPDVKRYSTFITDALKLELAVSDMYSEIEGAEITGKLTNLELHAASLFEGNWIIELEISINGSTPFNVKVDRPFSSSFSGAVACSMASRSFVPTVQLLINNVVSHPMFIQK